MFDDLIIIGIFPCMPIAEFRSSALETLRRVQHEVTDVLKAERISAPKSDTKNLLEV